MASLSHTPDTHPPEQHRPAHGFTKHEDRVRVPPLTPILAHKPQELKGRRHAEMC
ncbi:hypothetical protein [Limisphaera sp. 4302-co]|uniref:hypothetical protein n=1 Tax=Limisphaera sp. 4302-co TaxID=3400417 RepID=UPI003C23E203